MTRRAAVLAPLLALTLAGCSAQAVTPASPESSRMTRPTSIPTVEDPDAAGPTDPSESLPSDGATEIQSIPEQIWVRSATYTDKTYTVTMATAPGGTFTVDDTHALGGGTLSVQGSETNTSVTCTEATEKPLTTHLKGALATVTRLVTVRCPAPSPMERPVITGTWGDGTKQGMTSATFVVGGEKSQGRPYLEGDSPVDLDEAIDVTVQSVRHSGDSATITVWATKYAGLDIFPADDRTSPPSCKTTVSGAQRPGVKVMAPQRLFTLTCTGVKTLKGYTLMVSHPAGKLGMEAIYNSESVPLS